jgi:hypothetical protein
MFLPVVGLLCAGLALPACADEGPASGWENELLANFNLTHASFDNWSQGGENALAWQMGLAGKFSRSAERHRWDNSLKLGYGMTKVEGQDARKSVDEIALESVFTYTAGRFVDPYVAATARTQFTTGYEYTDDDEIPISALMDPGYFTQSIGVAKRFGEILTSRLGFSLKETLTSDYPVPYADDTETEEIEDTRTEAGIESVTELDFKVSDNLALNSKLGVFSDLEATRTIDLDWDNQISAKVEEYLTVSLNFRVLYDRDVSTKRQIKQSLAMGITYALM